MSAINANASGRFRIGDMTINRLGYGAMRITGPRNLGDLLPDRDAALATLRRLPEIGANFIDTADSYVSEELIREALQPYKGLAAFPLSTTPKIPLDKRATSTADDVLAGIDFNGKRVLVTGVSAGLGVETARALAAAGSPGGRGSTRSRQGRARDE
jgi:hypothetical protein